MKFKDNLKNLRIKKGYTQKELSNKLNMPIKTYLHYEQGESKTINFILLEQLTKILDCSYDDLLK